MTQPVEWTGKAVRMIDQTMLPGRLVARDLTDYRDVVEAIRTLRIRGAPVIGIGAAYGIALGARSIRATSKRDFVAKLDVILKDFAASRPTAVDLFHAVDRMRQVALRQKLDGVKAALVKEAKLIHAEQVDATARLSRNGADFILDGFTLLTHCNAGTLATAGEGTALGVIKAAVKQGKRVSVYATETRPLLQGARLTAWELRQAGIPVTLITDSMAGHFMSLGAIDGVIVGADRIAANGDVANKVGTYTMAVLAKAHGVPFYVAAPSSTFDLALPTGKSIPIEERGPEEVTHIRGKRIAPRGIKVANPAFDVTPRRYVTAIFCERGVVVAPDTRKLKKLFKAGTGSAGRPGYA